MDWCYNLLQFEKSETQIALALCIGDYDKRYTHSGIAYKDNGQIRFFHLAFHFCLKDEIIENSHSHYLFVPFGDISSNSFDDLISMISFIKKPSYERRSNLFIYNELRFSIYFDGGTFNPITFKFTPNNNTVGLSCSTLIIALFDTVNINLINMGEWQKRNPEDAEFHKYIIDILSEHESNASYIELNKSYIGCVRYRPEEVVSSISHSIIPSGFNDCWKSGIELKNLFFQ
jgi:hypothetical protein